MTFLEKAKQEHRISNEDHTIRDLCPSDLGYEAKVKCKAIIGADEKDRAYICRRCWEREMPGTEPKMDNIPIIPQSEVDAYNKGHADGMAQGLNDAWKLAGKIVIAVSKGGFDENTIIDIFGEIDYGKIFGSNPQEALEKLKAYENSKIEVGDVLKNHEEDEILITCLRHGTTEFDGFSLITGGGYTLCKTELFKKTGKHIEIKSILEQIGE